MKLEDDHLPIKASTEVFVFVTPLTKEDASWLIAAAHLGWKDEG